MIRASVYIYILDKLVLSSTLAFYISSRILPNSSDLIKTSDIDTTTDKMHFSTFAAALALLISSVSAQKLAVLPINVTRTMTTMVTVTQSSIESTNTDLTFDSICKNRYAVCMEVG